MEILEDDFIDELEVPEPKGPITWHDKEMRCASRGCGSSTYIKVEGIPRCTAHALRIVNEMFIDHVH